MGWTSYNANFYKNGKVDRLAEIRHLYENEENFKILKMSAVGRTVYMAVERTYPNGEKIVFGAVYLTSTDMKSYDNFAYKDMDETMGPCESDCPESILKLLTPTDNEYALRWRERCLENAKKKKDKRKNPDSLSNLPIGSIIEMKSWEEGKDFIKLEKIDYPRYKSPIWYSRETGYRYKPKTIESQGYTVVYRKEVV